MKALKHVRQEDENGCVIACIAMVTGETYKAVKAVFDRLYPDRNLGICGIECDQKVAVLEEMGFGWEICYPRMFPELGYYIIAAPSINKSRGLHAMVIDFSDIWELLDPQKGNKNKLSYTTDTLVSYAESIRVFKKN